MSKKEDQMVTIQGGRHVRLWRFGGKSRIKLRKQHEHESVTNSRLLALVRAKITECKRVVYENKVQKTPKRRTQAKSSIPKNAPLAPYHLVYVILSNTMRCVVATPASSTIFRRPSLSIWLTFIERKLRWWVIYPQIMAQSLISFALRSPKRIQGQAAAFSWSKSVQIVHTTERIIPVDETS